MSKIWNNGKYTITLYYQIKRGGNSVNTATKKMKNYSVKLTRDYVGNTNGSEVVEEYNFTNKKEALKKYKALINEYDNQYDECGYEARVELELHTEDDIFDIAVYPLSSKVLNDVVVVTYQHDTFLNYCYVVKDVRKVSIISTDELNPNLEALYSDVDNVYESVGELQEAYEKGYGIFAKLKRGAAIVERFLAEQGVEGYKQEEEEEAMNDR